MCYTCVAEGGGAGGEYLREIGAGEGLGGHAAVVPVSPDWQELAKDHRGLSA